MTGRTVYRGPATAMFVYPRDSFRFAVEEAVKQSKGFFITKFHLQISPQNAPWATLLEHTELSFVGLLGNRYLLDVARGRNGNLRLPLQD